MEYYDKNYTKLLDGDIIDINQTVNGQCLFVVKCIDPLDIRYRYDITRKYEYDKIELITYKSVYSEIEFEIIGNIIPILRKKKIEKIKNRIYDENNPTT